MNCVSVTMRRLVFLLLATPSSGLSLCGLCASPRRAHLPSACAAAEQPEPSLSTYTDAEAQGFALYKASDYERAIRMFELAQTLPGDGVDFRRQKSGGMVGSASAPPNPREWGEERFATAEQKLVAEYNIACCCAALGDTTRAMEILRDYADQQGDDALNQVNEMLVDDDLLAVHAELRALREEYKRGSKPGLFGLPFLKNPIREVSDSLGVEWKD